MATRFYGISRDENSATVSNSTTSKEVEVAVNDATGLSRKSQIETAIEKIRRAIQADAAFTAQ